MYSISSKSYYFCRYKNISDKYILTPTTRSLLKSIKSFLKCFKTIKSTKLILFVLSDLNYYIWQKSIKIE